MTFFQTNSHKSAQRVDLEGTSFTRVPNWFLDETMTELSFAELKIMLYIFRHTLGYGKVADWISYDQFLNGIVTHDGRQLDKGAGISRRSLITGLSNLEHRKLISRHHNGWAVVIELRAVSHPQEQEATATPASTTPKNTSSVTTAANSNQPSNLSGRKRRDPEIYLVQPEHLSSEKQVQTLHLEEEKQVQPLHLTIDNPSSQNKQNRVAAAVSLLVENIIGLTTKEAERLVLIAFNNERDEDYFLRLVQYVTNTPAIHTPAAVLTSLIKSNQDRTLPGQSSQPRHRQPQSEQARRQGHANRVLEQRVQQLKTTALPLSPALSTSLTAVPTLPTEGLPKQSECQDEDEYSPDFKASRTAVSLPTLEPFELAQVWERVKVSVIDQWSINPQLLNQGKLQAGSEAGRLALELPQCQDGLVKIRVVQTLKRVVGEEWYINW